MPVTGIARVKRELKAELSRLTGPVSEKTVYEILSQGAALAETRTPIDQANLIDSQTAPELTQGKDGIEGTIGYTAEYAAAVHEASGSLRGEPRANGNGEYWDPDGEPGFLEKGFDELKPAIPTILRNNYRV